MRQMRSMEAAEVKLRHPARLTRTDYLGATE